MSVNSERGLQVLEGRSRKEVGFIQAQVGMLTSKGRITKITPSGTVFCGEDQFRRPWEQLTVTLGEARKRGFNTPTRSPATA